MNLVADEGIDRQIVELLRARGYAVLYVAELAPGLGDDAVLAAASESGALLLTHDLDFGELVFRQRRVASGVLLLRLGGLLPATKATLVAEALAEHGAELLGHFGVVTPGALRVRGLGRG